MTVGRSDGGEGEFEPVKVALRQRRPYLFISLIILAIVVALLLFAWIERRPIAERFIESELTKRGVRAEYKIESIGLHNQVISNIRIGDPARPDLTARYAKIQMRLRWNGSVEVYRIVARDVFVRGELLKSGMVTWGDIDKLLPPPSGKPFTLPDISVDVDRARLALKTPYGPMGFVAHGAGNLTGGFKGRLAASAPALDLGACSLRGMRASTNLAIVARRPQVQGPLLAQGLTCPASRLAFEQPRLELDSSFSEGFDSFDGRGRMSMTSLVAGVNGLANLISNISFKGDATDARGQFDLAAQRARLAQIVADRTNLKGEYRLWAGKGQLAMNADYQANSAALAPALVAKLTGPLEGARRSPLGPITSQIAEAVQRTAGGFDATGKLVLVNVAGGGGVRVESTDARGPNGARVQIEDGDGITYYWPSGKLRVDGRIRTVGGGLPTADIALSQPRGGAPMSGEARIEPYSAGGARLALAPVTFRAATNGSTVVQTVAVMDGPFPGGTVRGLRIPIDGRIGGPAGGFAFGQGCIEAQFASLNAGSLRLRGARIPLCPTGGALVSKSATGPLQLGAVTRNLRLGGSLGRSPFALTANEARLSGKDRFDLARVNARFGNPAAPIKVNAAKLGGRLAEGGAAGDYAGGDAIIGKVPVGIRESAGKWDFRRGILALNGSGTAYDLNENPRFYPLKTSDLVFRLANDQVSATATLNAEVDGSPVTKVTIDHRLSSGTGGAVLDVPGIAFQRGRLQPEHLTRLTEGVIALVNGSVTGQGRINWSGDGSVSSSGEFTTQDMDLAAAFGPVEGLSTTVNFTDLLAMETAPNQVVSVRSLNPGIEVLNGEIRYQLLRDQLVKVERGEWPFMGGTLILEETILNFAKPTAKRLTFTVVGLDANQFVGSMQFDDLQATGIFDGALPMIFDEDGGRIVGGRLESRDPGGTLSYEGAINKANLGFFGGLAFDALKSLRYQNMVIRLDGDLAGEFATRITVDQVGLANATGTQRFLKGIVKKIPFKFNVSIKGPFRSLIATAKSIRDPRVMIRDVLPVPLDEIPGVITEVRVRAKDDEQTQTPVNQKIEVSTKPPSESEEKR